MASRFFQKHEKKVSVIILSCISNIRNLWIANEINPAVLSAGGKYPGVLTSRQKTGRLIGRERKNRKKERNMTCYEHGEKLRWKK